MKLLGCVFVLADWPSRRVTARNHNGLISDPAAVVPAAAVEARNTATGAVYQALSTGNGNYALSELPTGH
jgi:hypothetical protein